MTVFGKAGEGLPELAQGNAGGVRKGHELGNDHVRDVGKLADAGDADGSAVIGELVGKAQDGKQVPVGFEGALGKLGSSHTSSYENSALPSLHRLSRNCTCCISFVAYRSVGPTRRNKRG